jgi:septal ring factor EnvC (AmiA/AmiB activator)
MSESVKLENKIKNYQKQLEEKEQLLNQINNVQTKLLNERKELENNYNLNIKEKENTIKELQQEKKSGRYTESRK